MRLLLSCLLIFFCLSAFGHRGEVLAIEQVKVSRSHALVTYEFQIENIIEQNVAGVRVEFLQNGITIDSHAFPFITASQKYTADSFTFSASAIDSIQDLIQIEITEIFNQKYDWGGWDSPHGERQVNTLNSEFYVDAPWRMKKTDGLGNDNTIPVHFFLHDADLVTGFTIKIDHVDIKVKNASSSSFGTILTYDTITSGSFTNYFSCISPNDPGLSIQAFDLGAFSATSSHTIDFDGETDLFDEYVSVDATYWYFTFNIPIAAFNGFENVVDIEATIGYANTLIPGDDVIRMRVFRSDAGIPTQADYYRGDTHLHSLYTQNNAEIGLPLCSTKEAASLIGLDWITTTDHTSDFDNYGNGNINDNWNFLTAEVAALNSTDSSMIFIAGQEVAVNNSVDELVHMLVYPSYSDPFSLPFLGDGDGDLSATSISIDNVVTAMQLADGFSYCSHPFATGDKLPDFPVNGGIWNLGDVGFAVNGDNFPETGGAIICNDPASPSDILSLNSNEMIKEGIRGSQIWNLRWSLEVGGLSGDELDPFDVTNSGNPLTQSDTAAFSFHYKRMRQGQEVVNHVNQMGLMMKNTEVLTENWKMYYSAGSDAHGSFNSSNTDNFGSTGDLHNNAVGKLNTLVYCPNGMGTDGTEVLKSLYDGMSTMSDGPILTMGVSTNGDNLENELFMGQDAILDYYSAASIYVNFNYTSTQEFGDIVKMTFVVGTETGELKQNLILDYSNGDHMQSFNLKELVDSLFGIGNGPIGEYFYIRAELETFVDYSSASAIYRTDFDYFHSFTNPIWIKWDLTSAVAEEEYDFKLFPNPTNGMLSVLLETNSHYDSFALFNNLGQLLIDGAIETTQFDLDLSNFPAGMYSFQLLGRDGKSHFFKVVKL